MMHNFATIPEKGCELQDVSGDELSHITRAGGWVVISAYEAKWSRHDGEHNGMRYLIARVDPTAAIGQLRDDLDKMQRAVWKADGDMRTARELWTTERQDLTEKIRSVEFRLKTAVEFAEELKKQGEASP